MQRDSRGYKRFEYDNEGILLSVESRDKLPEGTTNPLTRLLPKKTVGRFTSVVVYVEDTRANDEKKIEFSKVNGMESLVKTAKKYEMDITDLVLTKFNHDTGINWTVNEKKGNVELIDNRVASESESSDSLFDSKVANKAIEKAKKLLKDNSTAINTDDSTKHVSRTKIPIAVLEKLYSGELRGLSEQFKKK